MPDLHCVMTKCKSYTSSPVRILDGEVSLGDGLQHMQVIRAMRPSFSKLANFAGFRSDLSLGNLRRIVLLSVYTCQRLYKGVVP